MRPAELNKELKSILSNGTHGGSAISLFHRHIQCRSHIRAADRGMRIPCSLGAMTLKKLRELIGIFGKVLEFDSAISRKDTGFASPLHAHHDVQTRFAHLGNAALHRRVNLINPAAPLIPLVPAKAKFRHKGHEAGEDDGGFLHVIFGKLNHQKCGGISADGFFNRFWKMGIERASAIIVSSISSTATGSSVV